MDSYLRFGALMLLLLFPPLGTAGHPAAQPRGDAGPGMVDQGSTGPGMMGQGPMGRGMMQGPAAPAPGGKAAGAAVYRSNFAACHTLRAGGGSKIGPNLHGLFGRWAGRLPGYRYSAAMVRSGVTWDNKTLDAFLANPHRFIPGDNMAFQAIPDSEQRQALITFLQSATRW